MPGSSDEVKASSKIVSKEIALSGATIVVGLAVWIISELKSRKSVG